MRWYEGGIADAVALSKSKRAIFVVYVEGKDETSLELTNLINNEQVSTKLESDDFVAIKIEANTLPHQQFSQIYPAATAPSLFFIGKSGTPLEIITTAPSLNDFDSKLAAILEKHGVKQQSSGHSETFIKHEQSTPDSEMICENGVCKMKEKQPSTSDSPKAEPSASSSKEKELCTEEKIERAQELIEKKREAKELEEKEKERLKEIERRKTGQNVQKLKRWQEDQELKSLIEERDKEKREEQAARERILAQIAQDKAERAAKFSTSPQPQRDVSPQPVKKPVADMNKARLQFKLPDGSSHAHEFSSNETLQTVRNYIVSNVRLPFNNYVLSTAFPRREFTDVNNSDTLADLGLVPTAVVLVLPLNQGVVSTNNGGSLSVLFWSLLSPFLSIFEYIRIFIFGRPSQQPQSSQKETVKRPAETGESSRSPPKKRTGETTVIRRQGNIHRLSDKTDSDDDNNTWNGNSTQQM